MLTKIDIPITIRARLRINIGEKSGVLTCMRPIVRTGVVYDQKSGRLFIDEKQATRKKDKLGLS